MVNLSHRKRKAFNWYICILFTANFELTKIIAFTGNADDVKEKSCAQFT